MSDASRAYVHALFGFDAVVRRVDPSRWDAPSPCEGWSARDVVDHVCLATAMVSGMAGGKPAAIADGDGFPAPGAAGLVFAPHLMELFRGGAIGDDDPVAVWDRYRDAAFDAVRDDDIRHQPSMSPWGHETIEAFLPMVTADAVIHTWDLATAAGLPHHIDPGLAVMGLAEMQGEERDNGKNFRQRGVMSAAVDVAGDDAVDALLAFSGRAP